MMSMKTFLIILLFGTTLAHAECDIFSFSCIQKHVVCLTATPYAFQSISFSDIQFDDPLIQECAHQIEQSRSFKPLTSTWELLQAQDVNEVVLGQFSLLLLLSYHTVFSKITQKTRLTWLSIISLYAQLSMIPLPKLFDTLEECWSQYQKIIADFTPDKEESFVSWAQNYWWVPTTIIIFTGLSFLKWFRGQNKIQKIKAKA
jgi:hypothetical protein